MRLGASKLVTSPQSDLTTHDAPEVKRYRSERGQRIGGALEGATGRWVPVAPLLIDQNHQGINPIFLRNNFTRLQRHLETRAVNLSTEQEETLRELGLLE